jgi:hypothetical protein
LGRKLFYQDSYGYIRQDRKAERASSGGMGFGGRALTVLAVPALIVVTASAIH